MKSSPATLLLLWSAVCVADEIVPVHQEPFHRPVADTAMYRVLDVRIPPGKKTLFHTHAEPTLYVTLHRSMVRAQRLDDEWGEAGTTDWAPGDVRYDGAAIESPFTHRVENLGDEDFRLILIASIRQTPGTFPELMASMPGQPGLDNEFFAQSRIDLEAGEPYRFSGGDYPLILVLAAGAQVELIGPYPDVVPNPVLRKPGDIMDAGARAGSIVNQGDVAATIIAVAIR